MKFVKHNLRLILETPFRDKVYKQNKKEYFSDQLQNEILIKDVEIARTALEYMIKINYIKDKDALQGILQSPFFSRDGIDTEYYIQKFDLKHTKPDLDLSQIEKEEYKSKKLEEIKDQVLEDSTREIEEQTKIAKAAYDSVPSILDQQQDISEPEPIDELRDYTYDPWWKRLGLRSNPFPTIDGLGNIDPSMHERIIVKTEVYETYNHYLVNEPSELFKNIVFYGPFGSGKTTLFEYLKHPLIRNDIYPVDCRLPSEPDYQNFLMKFKRKLSRELINIFLNLTGTNLTAKLDSTAIDDAIVYVLNAIKNNHPCNGFVIFVDDIYKNYEKTALKFLNYLQTFKAELTLQANLPDIGFFISAPPHWELILNENPAYSGSVSWEEHMPLPTVEQARSMFNERLAAFAINENSYKEIKSDFAHQVYRTLESKRAFTFREFIKECLRRFDKGKFDILTSNPISISSDTLRDIMQLIKRNSKLEDGINQILNASMSVRNKTECFQLLVQIFNEGGYAENSDVFQHKIFHFKILKNAGLITKSKSNSAATTWNVSIELSEFSKDVLDKYAYCLDDYFLKLFERKLEIRKKELLVSERKDFILIQKLMNHLENRNDGASASIRSFLDEAKAFNKQIILEIDRTVEPISFNKLVKDCQNSIKALSNAVASHVSLPVNNIDFWKDFWYYPDSLYNFSNVLQSQSSAVEPNSIWLFSAYESAFSDILSFLSEQIEKSEIMFIPVTGLKNEEIAEFNAARVDYSKAKYTSSALRISTLVENKLREFIYSVFILQYGDSNHRLQRIPKVFHTIITDHKDKDKGRGLAPSQNELTYLNRQHYFEILVGRHGDYNGIGYNNWINTFSKIFSGWDLVKMRSYLNIFYQLNLVSAHHKEVLTGINQSDIYQYLIDSVRLIVMINRSYFTFLEKVMKSEIPGSADVGYYFSMNENKYLVQPVRKTSINETRIIDLLKESINTIDLSCPSSLEQKYGVGYAELFTILTDILNDATRTLQLKMIKKNDPVIILQVK